MKALALKALDDAFVKEVKLLYAVLAMNQASVPEAIDHFRNGLKIALQAHATAHEIVERWTD